MQGSDEEHVWERWRLRGREALPSPCSPPSTSNWWLEFPAFPDTKIPFHDKRVSEAISLAIDPDAMNQAECDGLGQVDGNCINDDVEFGMDWPTWPHDVAKAKPLLAEAGYPNGFTSIGGHRRRIIICAARASSPSCKPLASA